LNRPIFARVRASSGAVTFGPLGPLELARWIAVREAEDHRVDLVDETGEPMAFVRRSPLPVEAP
jgi:hypothetical protein